MVTVIPLVGLVCSLVLNDGNSVSWEKARFQAIPLKDMTHAWGAAHAECDYVREALAGSLECRCLDYKVPAASTQKKKGTEI